MNINEKWSESDRKLLEEIIDLIEQLKKKDIEDSIIESKITLALMRASLSKELSIKFKEVFSQ